MPRTLYLRNVPDEVAERLEREAAREGTSLNAVAVRALGAAVRPTIADVLVDAELLGTPGGADIVELIREGREERAAHLEQVAAEAQARRDARR